MNLPVARSLLLATFVFISSENAADYSAEIGHSSEFSDNADLTDSNQADEREDRTWLELGFNFERNNWLLESDYQLTAVRFSSDSDTPQTDTEEIVGATAFSILGFKNRARLDVNHRRESLLGTPGELNLQSNFQERDSLNISPRWFFQNNSRQQLYLEGIYNRIDYHSDTNNNGIDSETQGARLGALRKISKINSLGLQLQQQTTQYKDDFTEDNQYTSLVAFWSRTLRQLNYSVVLGYNRSELGNDRSLNAPQFSFTAEYDNGVTSLEHATQYFITDTSRGNSSTLNQDSSQDSANLGNGNTNSVSRYELISTELNLRHNLGRRWTLGLLLQLSQQDHEEDPTQDRLDTQVLAQATHSLSNRWAWAVSVSRNQQTFSDDTVSNDNDQDRYSTTITYRPNPKLRTRLILNHRVRTSETGATDYTENTVLAEITYQLHP